MIKNVNDWLREGEELFGHGLSEYRALDEQIAALEQQRAEKWEELNAMAGLLGRKTPEAQPATADGRDAQRRGTNGAAVATTLGGRK